MTDKIKELLAVLDLPEDEQVERIFDYYYKESPTLVWDLFDRIGTGHHRCKISLADLAFRLRDEADELGWLWKKAKESVWLKYHRDGGINTWFVNKAQPIHWIIAAMIAKELSHE